MKTYDFVVIGFGKAGKTFAKTAASKGKKVAVIEQSPKMYGGTCINIGCIPSKTLIQASKTLPFTEAMTRKTEVVQALNQKNYLNLADDPNIDVYDGKATFQSEHEVCIEGVTDETMIRGDVMIINTGATPVIPEIEGVKTSRFVYDSTGVMALSSQPQRLVIIGGGYIALEFASLFASFGTEVTVLERHTHVLSNEDDAIVKEVTQDLESKGVRIVTSVEVEKISDTVQEAVIETSNGAFHADAILLASGRTPNTDIGLENVGIALGDKGEIKVNAHLQTAVPHIYAVGDVKGGPQFTYVSLDDFRIIHDHVFGTRQRTTKNRGEIPYTVFIDPPLSRIGLTAAEAQKEGFNIKEGQLPVKQIPRHKINDDPRGLFKVVIDANTNLILGASLYGAQSEELINLIHLAMKQGTTYDVMRDMIYTHPTMAESFNDLFKI
ncbi:MULTISPECIES: hypothiocyanous acid reductase MerA [Staphylococcus]|uniref:Dihydrolipoamide dehydrogenase n=1 Tax=Staphylococcus agnetis TaxID=985762 RepID=A0A2T4MH49_9STAP|nr:MULTISPECIES: hypothiocyanous acid reductase MerA [Staphylococcus]NHM91488.1 FAD-dependent oxidoreductase [Staphylococcus sp. 10602379]NJI01872.1 dihydrolipoamide dehydrogenase [Staphylococcus agnetis]NJI12798.1 dihydrolipoamide dehydrogenase [Staphylococcus agnetis]PTH14306.1 dihydrolipoamide dehydrogenase [Staphylococcus agnetis]PTH28322.1 dihydrolipoamide dehydrogenase [Staphylococcus agnetis]